VFAAGSSIAVLGSQRLKRYAPAERSYGNYQGQHKVQDENLGNEFQTLTIPVGT
jgi:hypothetical protein